MSFAFLPGLLTVRKDTQDKYPFARRQVPGKKVLTSEGRGDIGNGALELPLDGGASRDCNAIALVGDSDVIRELNRCSLHDALEDCTTRPEVRRRAVPLAPN